MARSTQHEWFSIQRFASRRRDPRRRSGTRPFHRRLRIEPLEDRRLLAVVTIDTLDDTVDFNDGVTSLREALFATNLVGGADTIEFSASLTSGGPATLTLTHGELPISDDLTINGPGADLLTIDASGNDPTPDSTLDDDVFNDGDGSRVFNIDDANVDTQIDVSISGLTLTGGDMNGSGGAIRSSENLAVTGSTISGNSALGGGGGIFSDSQYGAGGNVTVTDSTISDNSASDGGGIFSGRGDLTVNGSTIDGNSAYGSGGGIFNDRGDLTVTGSTISGNSAGQGGGGISGRVGRVTVTNSTISGNSARGSGGGIYSRDDGAINSYHGDLIVTHSTISGNMAKLNGGGIFSRDGEVTIVDSAVFGNSSDKVTDRGDRGGGGGIFNGRGDLTVTRSTISGNSSVGSDGGGINSGGDGQLTITNSTIRYNSAVNGGGIADRYGTLTATGSTISGNSATNDGGGIWGSRMTVTGSTISGNSATNEGGGINSRFGSLTMTGSTLSGNSARYGSGGGAYIFNTLNPYFASAIRHSTITGNSARDGGGGAFIFGGSLALDHTILAANSTSSGIGPDLTGVIGTTFDVRFSLIGNNAHSGLASTPRGLPDANGNLIGPVVSVEPLLVYLDMAAMGDFEAGPDGDSFLFEYSIDGGAFQPLFTSSVDEASSQTYFMDRGTQVVLDDPLSVNGVVLNNEFQFISAVIPDGGGQLRIRFTATNDGPSEVFAWRHLYVYGQNSGLLAGAAVQFGASSDRFAAYAADPDYTISGDMFGIRRRSNPGIPGLPSDITDDSTSIFPGDTQGIIGPLYAGQFFGVVDTVNGVGNDTDTATWTFNDILVPLDPKLGPLANNGGTTLTHALLPGSPALDAGNPAAVAGMNGVPEFDQRGNPFIRVVGAAIDVGAFELEPALPALFGDYNHNGIVDAADYSVWRNTLHAIVAPYSGADGSGNGLVDQADCSVWKAHFGQTLSSSGGGGVSVATASAALVAPSDELTVAKTSISSSAGKPRQTAQRQRNSDGEQAASPRENPPPALAPAYSPVTSYRPSLRRSVGPQRALVGSQRDEALLAWLAAQPDSRKRFDDSSDVEVWANIDACGANDFQRDTVEQVFALLASR